MGLALSTAVLLPCCSGLVAMECPGVQTMRQDGEQDAERKVTPDTGVDTNQATKATRAGDNTLRFRAY